ncbi:SDR family NAD(P)-dependent oxidoreductase [Ectothiorhodospiraceae bacterium BW-2]|nr:SDR family NAD(P)-dependent oxidoreductase [Ectothiorhodospiraceae bacterium BW-2]
MALKKQSQSQVVVITGCSSGIGLATAQLLHERGHQVFATARRADDVVRLQQQGWASLLLDLDDSASISSALQQIVQYSGGRIDVLFNNGAYGQPGAVEDLPREVLQQQFQTNLFGTHELTRQVIPLMRQQGYGRIIFNSSVLGLIALPFRGAYNASKYALEGLADTLRLELYGSGIEVSLIEPGPIESRFRANSYAAWQRTIAGAPSHFTPAYTGMIQRLTKEGAAAPFTLPAEAVARKVVHAVESRRPKARYFVTFPTWLFGLLRRLLTTRQLDWVLRRVSADELVRGESRDD